MQPTRPPAWVGRASELAVIRAGADALGRGVGTVVWVEGEPGIGKSSLVAEALAPAVQPGWDVGWGGADQLTRLPLRVMQDCLGVRLSSPDPRRARAAGVLRGRWEAADGEGDAAVNGIEVLLTLADELCAAAPTVLVVDDLQWADEASLVVWHELAASISQLRLLLIATCRPTSRSSEVQQVRATVVRRGGHVLSLGPLPEPDVTALVGVMVGATPGEGLRQLTAQAGGNPLYVRELVDALLRENSVEVSPVAEISPQTEQLPASLAAVLEDRLSSVSDETAQLLRTAALLGGTFAVTDLAAVLRRPVTDVAANLQEAMTAGVVEGSGTELAFRHPLLRQALYEGMPEALRRALHAEVAQQLAATGADTLSVAQQLSAADRPGGSWARAWLVKAGHTLVARAPQLAVELLRRELQETPAGDEAWDALVVCLIKALLAVDAFPEAAGQASRALTIMTEPGRRGETAWLLAHAEWSAGSSDEAIKVLREALAAPGLPPMWKARLLALLAQVERHAASFDTAETIARQAEVAAEQAGDAFAMAQALNDLWLTHSIKRDHVAALNYVDRELTVVGDDPGLANLRSIALDCRTFTLQNLDEWQQAELAHREAREFAQRTGSGDRGTWATAAVLRYWLGQWDDALVELGFDAFGLVYSFLRERWSALLIHGVTALVAGRRDQRSAADQHLRAGLALPIEYLVDRENQDFLVAAHALSLEQSGETRRAMSRLAEMLPRHDGEMTLIHQWLPTLVRLALTVGDRQQARAAAQACQQEAAAETRPARAAAASLRCAGLLESDPDRLAEAVAHYRSVGPPAQLPDALEDLAAVLAERGYEEDARAALNEAIGLYEGMQATWDVRRAEGRLRLHGVKRVGRARRPQRPTFGWEALTPTEVKIAALVARGDSTANIASTMFLSRRTVQTYISHMLVKLDAKTRVDIVREALRQGVTA